MRASIAMLGRSLARSLLPGLAVVVSLAGCTAGPGSRGGPYPDACADLGFTQRRCDAIVDRARRGLDAETVAQVTFLPFERNSGVGFHQLARVELVLFSGDRLTTDIVCAGVGFESDRVCQDDPRIVISTGVNRDIPCAGEPPAGCATLPPPPRAESVATSTALRLAEFSIHLDHLGSYDVEIGAASLPDGVLSERSATIADPRPTDFWIDAAIRLEVRSDLSRRPPIGSIYRDPFDGPEPVHAFLVFDVVEIQPGAVLHLTDVVVR